MTNDNDLSPPPFLLPLLGALITAATNAGQLPRGSASLLTPSLTLSELVFLPVALLIPANALRIVVAN